MVGKWRATRCVRRIGSFCQDWQAKREAVRPLPPEWVQARFLRRAEDEPPLPEQERLPGKQEGAGKVHSAETLRRQTPKDPHGRMRNPTTRQYQMLNNSNGSGPDCCW
eukprot:CAMPEP_0168723860 /NCGR_PEP_ID=MMETSP0724-20121128/3337_1 /TAXON_ID=265536 /ORGANISM="Amphiprora sp., Strain CCMP467" /LENGTH=107 /DNA_ID=CAMNT_0008770589 /DNA_START=113 /DNA_END=433 /DNA_ORIENTATION=+